MMYKVLMPVDDNTERGLAQARALANLPNASEAVQALILYVFDDEDSLDPAEDESARNAMDVEAIQEVSGLLDEAGIEYEIRKDRADPVEAILAHDDENQLDAIIMGGRKRSPGGKVLFGSVTHSVLMNTDTPVVITGSATLGG